MIILFFSDTRDVGNNPVLKEYFYLLKKSKKIVFARLTNQCFDLPINNIFLYSKNTFTSRVLKKLLPVLDFLGIGKIVISDPRALISVYKLFPNIAIDTYFSFEFSEPDRTHQFELEVLALKNVKKIVIQDETRKLYFEKTRNLNHKVEWHLIPVSYSIKNRIIKEKESKSTKLKILFSGTIATWSGCEYIIDQLEKYDIPSNYEFTFHSRFVFDLKDHLSSRLLNLTEKNTNIKISDCYIDDHSQYIAYCAQFNIGIALYIPQEHMFLGKNLELIGLSSGKISAYILAGLRVLTSENKELNKLNNIYNIFEFVDFNKNLFDNLKNLDNRKLSRDIYENMIQRHFNITKMLLEII